MHGQVQLTVADTGPAIACAAVPLALPARGLPRLRCGHAACCEQQVPPVPRTQARPHAPLRSGGHPVAFHEYPLLPPRLLGGRQRRPLSPTSRPAPACVGRAWRAAAPLAPLASALVFSRRLLVRPCRLFVSKKTVFPKKKKTLFVSRARNTHGCPSPRRVPCAHPTRLIAIQRTRHSSLARPCLTGVTHG